MTKKPKSKVVAVKRRKEVVTDEIVEGIQQSLSAIERKLDLLINQSSRKPFEQNRSQGFNRFNRRDRDSRERTYTRAVCAECHQECEIPFKPTGDRPVYCKDCFAKHKNSSSFDSNRGDRPERKDFSPRGRFDKRPRSDKKKMQFAGRRKRRA